MKRFIDNLIRKFFAAMERAKKKYDDRTERRNILNETSLHNAENVNRGEIFDARKFGFSLDESFVYGLNSENYKDYINTLESYAPRKSVTRFAAISDDKYLFSLTFGKFIKTPKTLAIINDGRFVPVEEGIEKDTIYDCFLKLGGGVIKDRLGWRGQNIYIFTADNDKLWYKDKEITRADMEEIISGFEKGIVQTSIKQGSFENEIFDKSINTIRVLSIMNKEKGKHEVVAALQRIGNNHTYPVDNFCQGGGSALIDLKTGELGSMASSYYKTEDGRCMFFDTHPDTGAQIKGKVIPNWSEIKTQLEDLTEKLPYFEFIAWDVVLQDDGIALIETNMRSDLNVFQIHKGLRNSYLAEKYREKGYIED